MTDTLKTTTIGASGATVTWIGILPDIISVAVGLATFVYLVVKIKNELKR